jgi:hypothetical protein
VNGAASVQFRFQTTNRLGFSQQRIDGRLLWPGFQRVCFVADLAIFLVSWRSLKIGSDTHRQVDRLPDVQHTSPSIPKHIHPRGCGQRGQVITIEGSAIELRQF